MNFKKIKVELPGFKYPVVFVRELSIRQLNEVYKNQASGTELDLLLNSFKHTLVNEAGDKIINNDYTIDQFADEVPQSYLVKLSDAFAQLNGEDEAATMERAKNS